MAALSEQDLVRAPAHRLAWRLASDDVLARAAAGGSDAAFTAIYDRHHAALVRHCRGVLGTREGAEDAAQSAMAAALRALRGTGAQPVALRPWLYRIAHHEALAVARRRPAAGPALDEVELPAVEDREVRERLAELVGDLRELPERQRGALLLRELSGLEYDEIGLALETTPQAARQLVFAARGALSEVHAGRGTACADVRARLGDGDRRTLRARVLRAHLADCGDCTAFAREVRLRRRDLALLFPVAPGLALAAWVGGGASGAAGGTWAIGSALGGSAAAKCAVVCASAVLLGGGVVAVEETVEAPERPTPKVAQTPKIKLEPAAKPAAPRPTPSNVGSPPRGGGDPTVDGPSARVRVSRPAAAAPRAAVRASLVAPRPERKTRRAPTFTPAAPQPQPPAPSPAPAPTQTQTQTQTPAQTTPAAPTQARTPNPVAVRIAADLAAAQERVRTQVAAAQQQVKTQVDTALRDVQAQVQAALDRARARQLPTSP